MTDIALELIRPNPFRDFELHPIDDAQVEKLRASISRSGGLWPGVLARPFGDEYQLAFGHHRIEAARLEGLATAPIEVCEMSDGQMAVFLAAENATQRGTTAAASLDAIAALSRVITEECLRHNDWYEIAKIFAISKNAAQTVWGRVRHGTEPGEDCILDIAPKGAYTLGQIRLALSVLRDSGRLGDTKAIIFDARCARLFRLDYHLAEFKRFATDPTIQSYLSVEQQFGFAQRIIDDLGGQELTGIRLRERANILLYEMAGVARNTARRSPQRFTDDRVKDALNLMRRGASDIKRSCNLVADLIAEGADVSPEIVARFSQYVSDIETALRSLAAKGGGKRAKASNLRLIVNDGENVA